MKRVGELTTLTPILDLTGVGVPTISAHIVLNAASSTQIIIMVCPHSGPSLTDPNVTVSVGVVETMSGKILWHAPQVLAIRALPDSSQVVEVLVQDIYGSPVLVVALESTVATGTLDFFYSQSN